MSQPRNRWNIPIARPQEMRGISEGTVSSSSSRAPRKRGAEEDLVSADVFSAAMVESVETEAEGRGGAGTASARERRGAKSDGGVGSLARPGGRVGRLGEGRA